MSLFVVKNDKGLLMDDLGQFKRDRDVCAFHSKSDAKDWADNKHAHVVELIDKPEPEAVSQEEADMLEKAKHNPTLRPSFMITEYSNIHKGNILGNDIEDRLMHAYVIGWVVDKPKQWYVTVPHVKNAWYFINNAGNLSATYVPNFAGKFTDAEIEHYRLQDFEKEEVTDDEK